MEAPSSAAPSAGAGRPAPGAEPVFRERLDALFAPDVYATALPLVGVGCFCLGLGWWIAGGLGWWIAGGLGLALGLFAAAFFRNPPREIPGDERTVVAPADGRVVEAGEVELADGRKARRVGIFLSIFDVHVNRAPVAGRILAKDRSGTAYRAAFDRQARDRNVQLALELETAEGERVTVVQITGLVARRIVCHGEVGEWLPRGSRYGLIRFGSRTDVILPADAVLAVGRGETVRGGSSVLATLPGAGAPIPGAHGAEGATGEALEAPR